jgi:DNA-binding SARP family transcriptional activator
MLPQSQPDRSDALPAYRLRCFGPTQLHDAAGADCTPRARKTRALLIYVLLARNAPVSREQLAALLWADHGDEQARASVRQALYELKPLTSTPVPLIRVTRTHVSANDTGVATDIDHADALAQAAELGALTELLANTSLTLFADLDDLTPEFDDWLRAERLQRTERLMALCVAAGHAALARHQNEDVRALVAALESLDPRNEPVVRLGSSADPLSGDHAQAHRRYRRFAERLQRDLAAQPSAETRALLSRTPGRAVNATEETSVPAHSEPRVEGRGEPRIEPRGELRIEPRGEPRVEAGGEPRIEPRVRAPLPRFNTAIVVVIALLITTVALGAWRLTEKATGSRPTAPEIYRHAEALIHERREPDLSRARTLLLEATQSEPGYAPAWASLAVVTILLSDQASTYGPIPLAEARDQALRYANRAVALNPNLALAHAALGIASLMQERGIPHFRRAIELDPHRAEYHRWLGQAYEAVGRHREAFEEFKLAAEAEPSWASSVTMLIGKLKEMGREAEIDSLVQRFDSVSTVPYDREYVQFAAHHKRGELQAMVALGRELVRARPDDEQITFAMASAFAALGDRASALAVLQPNEVLFRAIVSHDAQRIERVARESPGVFWHSELDDARPGELLVASGRSKLLLELFDARYGDLSHVETLPYELMFSAPAVIVALREAGRSEEAAKLNRLALERIRVDWAGGLSTRTWSFEQAQQLALSGDSAGALAELEQMMQNRWTDLLATPFVPLSERIAFRDLRMDPRLGALQRQLDEHIRATREQIGAL